MAPIPRSAGAFKSSSTTKHKPNKHPKLKPSAGVRDPDTLTTGALRNTIRNLERLLKTRADKLPAGVVVEKERELAHYRAELEGKRIGLKGRASGPGNEEGAYGTSDGQTTQKKKRSKEEIKAVSKYHGVRFFERQKATRRLKKLKTQLGDIEQEDGQEEEAGQDKSEELKGRVHEAEVDLNYTIYSPLAEKYVSIFVEGDGQRQHDEQTAEKRREGKPQNWLLVEKAMAEDKLDDLRECRWPEKETSAKQHGQASKLQNIVAKKVAEKPAIKVNVAAHADPGKREPRNRKSDGREPVAHNRRERRRLLREQQGQQGQRQQKQSQPQLRQPVRQRDSKPYDNNDGDESDGGFFE